MIPVNGGALARQLNRDPFLNRRLYGKGQVNAMINVAAGVGLASIARKLGYGKKSSGTPVKQRGKNKKKKNYQAKGTVKLLKAMSGIGTRIYRRRQTHQMLSGFNGSIHNTLNVSSITIIEDALAELKYYDPSNPGTLLVVDAATGTFSKKYNIQNISSTISVRNNYMSDAMCRVYVCSPREDTSISPTVAYNNGLADVGNPGSTAIMIYPTDSPQFRYLWKIEKSKIYQIKAGRTIKLSHSVGPFTYDPSIADSHALTYQKKYGSFSFLVQLEGTLAHDSVLTEIGTDAAGLDMKTDTTYKILYDSGIDIVDIKIDDLSDLFTNLSVQSNVTLPANYNFNVS